MVQGILIRREEVQKGNRNAAEPLSVDGKWEEGTLACTDKELKVYMERFHLGPKTGRTCDGYSEEKLPEGKLLMPWESDLNYVNPRYPNDLALYIYPKEDHNGAFSLCEINEEGEFERLMCKRLLAASDRYSVRIARVSDTVAAEQVVKATGQFGDGESVRIHRLVLGGHGRSHKLAWGDEDEDEAETDASPALDYKNAPDASESFLRVVKGYLADSAVVFCDSCQGGKCKLDEMNFVQFVAYRLAGVEVCGSQNLLEPHMLDLFRDENDRPRLAVHNEKGIIRGTCARFPRGMEHWRYDYATSCSLVKRDSVEMSIPCSFSWKRKGGEEGVRARMLCEANQMDECRRMCASNDWCEAFVFFKKKKNNCRLVKTCKKQKKRHASAFWRPAELSNDDVAFRNDR